MTKAPERIWLTTFVKDEHGAKLGRGTVGDLNHWPNPDYPEYVQIDHALALVAAERKACAKMLNKYAGEKGSTKTPQGRTANFYARKIRARSDDDAQTALERVKQEVRNEALREVYQNLRTYAPHHDPITGPEHDVGYANGYHTAMNRVLDLITKDQIDG
jgi:hypothetical protein